MATEICQICKDEATPWEYIKGHICDNCAANARWCRGCHYDDNVGWINIKDELPLTQEEVFLRNENTITMGYLNSEDSLDWEIKNYSDSESECLFTHWMPIPPWKWRKDG